ncbi:hypothetical protein PRUB_a0997 [Pseudoalteromonas rubra]|uniref:Uncharacterized protein n=1 Tax=Pseudoalteromonas rubra TaxID=43658 RepID=A0A8T0C8Z5_9GAMM|nr:hypothetical protein PRUB_a0997 [Pseudoalteromonas rubra]
MGKVQVNPSNNAKNDKSQFQTSDIETMDKTQPLQVSNETKTFTVSVNINSLTKVPAGD